MTKNRSHPWPTDGVTRKQLDREVDRLTRRLDQQGKRNKEMRKWLKTIDAFLRLSPHAQSYQIFLAQEEEEHHP